MTYYGKTVIGGKIEGFRRNEQVTTGWRLVFSPAGSLYTIWGENEIHNNVCHACPSTSFVIINLYRSPRGTRFCGLYPTAANRSLRSGFRRGLLAFHSFGVWLPGGNLLCVKIRPLSSTATNVGKKWRWVFSSYRPWWIQSYKILCFNGYSWEAELRNKKRLKDLIEMSSGPGWRVGFSPAGSLYTVRGMNERKPYQRLSRLPLDFVRHNQFILIASGPSFF